MKNMFLWTGVLDDWENEKNVSGLTAYRSCPKMHAAVALARHPHLSNRDVVCALLKPEVFGDSAAD